MPPAVHLAELEAHCDSLRAIVSFVTLGRFAEAGNGAVMAR
jgi:hypothetical protein